LAIAMAAYYHGGAGTDIQASTDGLQTLYLMNPSYAGYADDAGTPAQGGANMMLLNSAVSTMTPASFGHQQSPPPVAQHFVGIPLQAQPSSGGYNLWTPSSTTGGDMSPSQQQTTPGGAAGVSAVLSLSSREAPPVTVAAVAGDEGKYHLGTSLATSQGQVVMNSKYLKAAQELLDEVVSVSKGVEEAKAAAAKSAAAVKKKEASEGVFGGGSEDAGVAKSGSAPELSTAERQELQMKKSKLINMLDEVSNIIIPAYGGDICVKPRKINLQLSLDTFTHFSPSLDSEKYFPQKIIALISLAVDCRCGLLISLKILFCPSKFNLASQSGKTRYLPMFPCLYSFGHCLFKGC
jgi:hypothetical protein